VWDGQWAAMQDVQWVAMRDSYWIIKVRWPTGNYVDWLMDDYFGDYDQ